MKLTKTGQTARKLASTGYELLSSVFVDAHIIGNMVINEARLINSVSVARLEQELEDYQEKWVDECEYDDLDIPLMNEVMQRITSHSTK